MVSQELARLFITLLATFLIARQAFRAVPGTRQRQAFTLGAAGFGLIALGNGLVVVGLGQPVLLTLLVGLGLALLIGCLISLLISFTNGELKGQLRRARSLVTAERDKVKEPERPAARRK